MAFLAGFVTQSMQYTFAVFGGASAMLALVRVSYILPHSPLPAYEHPTLHSRCDPEQS